MSIPAFAVRQPVLVNLVAISAVLIGALVMGRMHRESLPTMPTGWGNITTIYVGASPEEIEQLVSILIENAVGDVDEVEEIWGVSKEGVSDVSFHFDTLHALGRELEFAPREALIGRNSYLAISASAHRPVYTISDMKKVLSRQPSNCRNDFLNFAGFS